MKQISFFKLAEVAVANAAGAAGIDMTINGGANTALSLPQESLKVLGEFLYKGNPLNVYTTGLKPTETGYASIQMEWQNSNNDWTDKTVLGNGHTKGDIVWHKETIYWNGTKETSEGMRKSDLDRGALNVLPERLSKDFVKALIDGQKYMFDLVSGTYLEHATAPVPHDGTGIEVSVIGKVDTTKTIQEQGATILKNITDIGIKYVNANNFAKSDVMITIDPLTFNALAFAGLLGNKVEQTFAGGMYIVTIIGGFKIQSGDNMLATNTAVANDGTVAGATTTVDASQTTGLKTIAMIGTNDCIAYNHHIVAANIGTIDNTNDLESYGEYGNLTAVPKRTIDLKLIHLICEADAKGTADEPMPAVKTVNIGEPKTGTKPATKTK